MAGQDDLAIVNSGVWGSAGVKKERRRGGERRQLYHGTLRLGKRSLSYSAAFMRSFFLVDMFALIKTL